MNLDANSSTAPAAANLSFARWATLLGLLTAVGPFAIDMYLPALPALATSLAISSRDAQISVMAFFASLGAGQLVVGPMTDRWGRRRPMLAGLAAYTVASIGCATAPSLEVLVVMRVVQGLGACACMVTPRAVVRDLYSGAAAARLMSVLLTIYSVSPIAAPLLGSAVARWGGWRGVFFALSIIGACGLMLVALVLPETRVARSGTRPLWRDVRDGYAELLADREFVAVAMLASMSVSTFFVFVANSSFVYTAHFGVSPTRYAALFAVNAIVLVAMSRLTTGIAARLGLRRAILVGSSVQTLAFACVLVLFWLGIDSLAMMVVGLAIGFGINGVIVPSTFVLAMERHATRAGSASALIGTFNFAGGAAVVAMVSAFADGTALPMLAGICTCALIAFGLAWRSSKSAQKR